MKSLQCYVAVVLLIAPVLCIKTKDCGSRSDVTSVEVTGCDGLDVCPLKRGDKAKITIKFNSKEATNTLKAVVHGIIAGVPLPFTLPHPDACSESGISCPLSEGHGYEYDNELNVLSSYPPVSVTIKWELRDDNNADVVCVEFPAKLD